MTVLHQQVHHDDDMSMYCDLELEADSSRYFNMCRPLLATLFAVTTRASDAT